MKDPQHMLATRCVHVGERHDPLGSPQMPLYPTSTFAFPSTSALLDVLEGRKAGGFYTRYGSNPTIQALEEKLATLEAAEGALVFNSGMAAISTLLLAHARRGVVCIGTVYGGTLELMQTQLAPLGFPVHTLLGSELADLAGLLADGVGLVFFESPANPLLEVFDIQAISELAHRHDALVAVDSTFASPVNQQALTLGADLVVHSATKYLGGHSDLTAGAVMATAALLEPLRGWRKNLGQVASPQTCWLLARSLRTLVVRVERQNAGALRIAQAMQAHPRVARVLYPGLSDFPGHALARRQMSGFGGMLTLELDLSGPRTTAVVDRLRLFAIAPSLGGVESLATQPLTTTHHGMSAEERHRRGVSDGMVRLSVGLESPEDLIADLEQALGSAD